MQGNVLKKTSAAALCLLLSLLLHLLFALVLLNLPEKKAAKPVGDKMARAIRLHRMAKKEKQEKLDEKPPAEADKNKPFAKTDPDQAEQRPEREDFVGKRNARAASDENARGYEGESPHPSMTGEKKEELVAFDQQRQQGDLEYEGRRPPPDTPSPTPPPAPPQPSAPPLPSGASTPAIAPPPVSPEGDMDIGKQDSSKEERNNEQKERLQQADKTPRPLPPTPPAPPAPPTPRFYRDPSLANPTRAGFRTEEHRSRNAGRFVLGRHASLNVAATPRGRYEAEIYRRIAYWWYRACDEHRGDIIPGKIVVSLRLDNRGRLVNMDLIQRSGAGVIQQSFTFGAIRQASLPPMPPAVQEEIVGNLLELIFEFVFD